VALHQHQQAGRIVEVDTRLEAPAPDSRQVEGLRGGGAAALERLPQRPRVWHRSGMLTSCGPPSTSTTRSCRPCWPATQASRRPRPSSKPSVPTCTTTPSPGSATLPGRWRSTTSLPTSGVGSRSRCRREQSRRAVVEAAGAGATTALTDIEIAVVPAMPGPFCGRLIGTSTASPASFRASTASGPDDEALSSGTQDHHAGVVGLDGDRVPPPAHVVELGGGPPPRGTGPWAPSGPATRGGRASGRAGAGPPPFRVRRLMDECHTAGVE
jgi:hypothetical protein